MARSSGLDWVLTERDLEPVVRPLVTQSGSTIRGLQFPLEWSAQTLASDASRLATDRRFPTTCLLQHSSGTTGLQKAVALSHQAVLEHIHRYGESIGIDREDKIVSWLPFYHDMGLIAALYLALTHDVPLVQLDAFEWVAAPVILLETISIERGTLCWLPNFAYQHMADRIHQEDLEDLRLDSMRMFINCSEMVRAKSHDRFLQRFQSLGLKREALAACYAMAETTFAVTQTPPDTSAKVISVNRDELTRGRAQLETALEKARLCVSSGVPISGCEIRVVAESGEDLAERCVGEIAVRSVSLFEGYRNNPEKTAEVFRHGWFLTGDYGFLHGGECFVVGRKKDLIIVAGKNLYPEDIEDIVSRVDGVLPGRVVAVGVEDPATGTEQVWVIAEADLNGKHQKTKTQRAIVEAVMQIDVTVGRVFLTPPRWLIKSSAGKPSRKLNRDRALTELLPVRRNDV
jgi:acyl-CoA synthetase (AMP-forming)/AMP-acid ligase II